MNLNTNVIAHPNIALIKYWGKKDNNLFTPTKNSISYTLPYLSTTTQITLSQTNQDNIKINNVKQEAPSVIAFLNRFRDLFCIQEYFIVNTTNNFPTSAGVASSSSGFAALAKGLNALFDLKLSEKELSIVARQGSGSACRSIYNGFTIWHKGNNNDGLDSYAEQLFDEHHWPEFSMFVVLLSDQAKKISSRVGMQQTVNTCPHYQNWLTKSENRIPAMINGIKQKDLRMVGSLAEQDCLDMHYCMQTSKPVINYWTNRTKQITELITQMRNANILCYFTIDAGPNVKVMCLEQDKKTIVAEIKKRIPAICVLG